MRTTTNGSNLNGHQTKAMTDRDATLIEPGANVGGNGTSFEHDLIPHPRDPHGNRQTFSFAYINPVSGSKDLDETQLRHILDEIESFDAVKAAYLRWFYEDRLRPAYLRLQSVRSEVEAELAHVRARSQAIDHDTDVKVAGLTNERDTSLLPLFKKVQLAMAELEGAHADAAAKVADAGGCYNPANSAEEAVLRVEALSPQEVAYSLKVPWGSTAKAYLIPAWLLWIVTFVCGALLGLSLGILAGFVEELSDVSIVAVWVVLGQGPAIAMRKALSLSAVMFAESVYLRIPRCQQAARFVPLILLSVAFMLVALTVDQGGILKAAQLQALLTSTNRAGNAPFAMWCMAAFISLGYFSYAVLEGLIIGRNDAISNAVTAEIEQDYHKRSEARRELVVVKSALHAINSVREKLRVVAGAESDYVAQRDRYDQLIAARETQRLPYPEALSLEQKFRVQDAIDNLAGCQIDLDTVLAGAMGTGARKYGSLQTKTNAADQPKPKRLWDRLKELLRER